MRVLLRAGRKMADAKAATKESLCPAKMLNTVNPRPELGIVKNMFTRIRSRDRSVGPRFMNPKVAY